MRGEVRTRRGGRSGDAVSGELANDSASVQGTGCNYILVADLTTRVPDILPTATYISLAGLQDLVNLTLPCH